MPDDVKFVADEAQAVLNILDRRFHNCPIRNEDWQALFVSEGYIRLQQREEALGAAVGDQDFQNFILSNELAACYEALSATLYEWRESGTQAAAERALTYLPKGMPLRAAVYPVIKPQSNSFVLEVERDPEIFLYLDPKVSRGQFEAMLARELHRIGMGAVLRDLGRSPEWLALPAATRRMLEWMAAFGEGLAMLAAVGGPKAAQATHAAQEWQNFETDFRALEAFLLEVLNGKLEGKALEEAGTASGPGTPLDAAGTASGPSSLLDAARTGFSGVQVPWCAVGWKMAVAIERAFGKEAVVEAFCDPRKLLGRYNEAAGTSGRSRNEVPLTPLDAAGAEMPRWSEELVKAGYGE